MSQFGMINKNETPMQRSIRDMEKERIVLQGEGKNTFEKDGKYFVMNRSVSKEEYDRALQIYNLALDAELAEKKARLN